MLAAALRSHDADAADAAARKRPRALATVAKGGGSSAAAAPLEAGAVVSLAVLKARLRAQGTDFLLAPLKLWVKGAVGESVLRKELSKLTRD